MSLIGKRQRKTQVTAKICTLFDIQNQAQTIRLFDRSIWVNLGDGRIYNLQTGKVVSLLEKYQKIRTATLAGKIVFAKRFKISDPLFYLEEPYKVRICKKSKNRITD